MKISFLWLKFGQHFFLLLQTGWVHPDVHARVKTELEKAKEKEKVKHKIVELFHSDIT